MVTYNPRSAFEEYDSMISKEVAAEEMTAIQKQIAEAECDACRLDFSTQAWRELSEFRKFKSFTCDRLVINLNEDTRSRGIEKGDSFWCDKKQLGYVVQGKAEIDFGIKKVIFRRGDGICIPAGTPHKIRLLSKKMVMISIDELYN